MLKGKAFKFGDDISTDEIIPSKYMSTLTLHPEELAKHVMEDADPTFGERVKPGDFVVAGESFGIGSSREQAPVVIKMAGVSAVLAQSMGRIFFRNAINVGLPVLICNTTEIDDGDELEIDLEVGVVNDITKGIKVNFDPLPQVMLKILNEGGLAPYAKKYGCFKL